MNSGSDGVMVGEGVVEASGSCQRYLGVKGFWRCGGRPPLPVMMNLLFFPCWQRFWLRR